MYAMQVMRCFTMLLLKNYFSVAASVTEDGALEVPLTRTPTDAVVVTVTTDDSVVELVLPLPLPPLLPV